MADFKIAILGECMIELQQKGDQITRSFGGDTLNTAVYFARLTQEKTITTSYITALGNDTFSNEMRAKWDAEGVDTQHIVTIENKNPGLYMIETDDTGERSFHYWRNDAAAKYIFEQPQTPALLETLMGYDALYLSGISLAILTDTGRDVLMSFLAQFKAKGGKVMFDNNYRPRLWESKEDAMAAYKAVLAHTDIALLTFDDEEMLYGDTDVEQCIARTQDLGVKEIAIKRGADDCLVVEGEARTSVPALKADSIVDTTAAGDSFSGGYLAKRLTGGDAPQSAHMGHIVASTVIQHRGAIIPTSAMPANATV
ncbi:sugar kinase [Thaumasiovibrio subtropicus]|uniref:sugar kinase n=1 Tax=Thaumasiovibrio subtropicus TaxID=1891207 RepID=UPI000B350B9E|nr:sugar kinase [Thaumasiovibrio subtropicus]